MFIGHFGLGFGAKRVAPTVSLGTLFLAAQLADLLWPTLVLLGVERVEVQPGATRVTPLRFVSYPYSHGLLALCLWGALAGSLYWLLRRRRRGAWVGALTVGGLVVSHWVLDFVSHGPDMPLTFAARVKVGLGLWGSLPATVVVEGALFAVGVVLYTRATAPRDRVGSWGLWALVGFLAVVYSANLLGPPPPSAAAVAWSAEAMWLLVAWGYWIDRHRAPRLAGVTPARESPAY
jgi:hypothetical protein